MNGLIDLRGRGNLFWSLILLSCLGLRLRLWSGFGLERRRFSHSCSFLVEIANVVGRALLIEGLTVKVDISKIFSPFVIEFELVDDFLHKCDVLIHQQVAKMLSGFLVSTLNEVKGSQ